MEDWQKHVAHAHVDKPGTAWCGEAIESYDWTFISIDHAAYSAPKDRLQPCPACVDAIVKSLKGEAPP